jgi:hypothetical protein
LIASFEVENAPILLGDILITVDRRSNRPVSTPLVPQPNGLLSSTATHQVSGVSQKLLLLHDHLCLAWSGSLFNAAALASRLKFLVQDQPKLDYFELRDFIGDLNKDLRDLQYIIYCWTGEGWGYFSNLRSFELGALNNIRVAGSGTEHFVSNIEHFSNVQINGEILDYQTGLMRAISYAAMATIEQVFRGTGIVDRWGGGFEIVSFDGEKLKKQNKILWLFWLFEEIHEGELLAALLPTFIYQFYIDDLAYFWINDDERRIRNLYEVSNPLQKQSAGKFFDPPNFDVELVVCGFCVKSGNEFRDGVFIDFAEPGDTAALRLFINENDQISITIEQIFLDRFFQTTGFKVTSFVNWD